MGDVGDYWREAGEDRRRAKRRPNPKRCVCGHWKSDHDEKAGCERQVFDAPCSCFRFESEVDP